MLVGGRVFNDPWIMATERKLCHVSVEGADASKAILSECPDVDFLVLAHSTIGKVVLVELLLLSIVDLLLEVLFVEIDFETILALGGLARLWWRLLGW